MGKGESPSRPRSPGHPVPSPGQLPFPAVAAGHREHTECHAHPGHTDSSALLLRFRFSWGSTPERPERACSVPLPDLSGQLQGVRLALP